MAPPANTTAGTAVLISAFPYDVTQTDINDAGTNYDVWYKFTAPTGAKVMGAWGFSGNTASGYRPNIIPYNGPAGAPTQILSINFQNKPIQFPVVAGQEYFLKFVKNLNDAGPNSLRVQVEVGPDSAILQGNIVINDDTPGFPLVVLSQLTDYLVRSFVLNMPAGEACDVTSTGVQAFTDFNTTTIFIYDKDFVLVNSFAQPASGFVKIRTCRGLDKFYIGNDNTDPKIYSVTAAGVLSSLIATLTGQTSLLGIAASNDGTVLYYSNNILGSAIKRWDLVNNLALSNFAAADAAYYVTDILVLSDNTVVALYDGYFLGTVYLKVFNSSGTLLNTFFIDNTVHPSGTFCRAAYALDDPDSVWVWIHPTDGESRFVNVQISDGTFLSEITYVEFETGGYVQDNTATPLARFGPSFSCAFHILPVDSGGGGVVTPGGIYELIPEKRNDTIYTDVSTGATEDVEIPNPFIKTGLIGS